MQNAVLFDIDHMMWALARDLPFGRTSTILRRTCDFYQFVIDILAERSSIVRQVSSALLQSTEDNRRVFLTNPALRITLNEATTRMVGKSLYDLQPLETLIQAMLPLLVNKIKEADANLFLNAQMPGMRRLEDYPNIWLWDTYHPDHVISHLLVKVFQHELTLSGIIAPTRLCALDATSLNTITQGCALLTQLLPDLAQSLFEHVHLITVVDLERMQLAAEESEGEEPMLFESASYDAIPGILFLTPSSLRDPWSAAEAILHEGIHQKLNDIRLTYAIFPPGYSSESSAKIQATWNSSLDWNLNQWPVDRALGAFHVYVHLYLFFQVIARKRFISSHVSVPAMNFSATDRAMVAHERALYLGQALKKQAGNNLQADGYRLIDWMLSLLPSTLSKNA